MAKTEHENVTVKVPANLLRLLEEKNFFGKTKAEWFAYCVRMGVDAYLNELEMTECRRLEEKYGLQEKCGLPTLVEGESMKLNVVLDDEATKRFQSVKESFGMNSNTSVLNLLITREYERIQEATHHKLFVSKDTYDALIERANALGKTPEEYVEQIIFERTKELEPQTAKA